jgi:quinol monooxygenase YgiN
MNSQHVHFVLDLAIHEGKFADFENIVKSMTDGTATEPGALGYEWYLSKDNSRCRLLETYANTGAMQAHLTGPVVRELVPKVLTFATITRFEVYGEPDDESATTLSAFGAEIYRHWHGLPQRSGSSSKAAD